MRGIVGGMFDPIHFGHYKPALEAMSALGVMEMLLIPCARPPHRKPPQVSAQHRWNMVNIVADESRLIADDRELNRQGPSYTYDTLVSLKAESDIPLCLVLGTDALSGLPHWHQAEEILGLCHIVALDRNGSGSEELLPEPWKSQCTRDAEELRRAEYGKIYLFESTRIDCASSTIRAQIQAGESPRYCMPGSVWSYIQRHHLYGA